jgi:glycerol-3-phosphate acyltransferase PlsX
MSYTIAVDLMGSDDAPKTELAGIKQALETNSDLRIIAFGSAEAIKPYHFTDERLTYVYTSEVITADDASATAFRTKKEASMIKAIQAIKDGAADAVVSSGSTGAYITAVLFMLGRIKGVKRPALVSTLPSAVKGKKTVVGDLGAVADEDAETIAQNGVLVAEIARILFGIEQPKLALLNIGSEATKGSEAYVKAYELLKENKQLNFSGNIEPRYLMQGEVDGIISGGLAGNIALKSYEGAIELVMGQLKTGLTSSIVAKSGALLIKPALRQLKATFDYDTVGGAIVAGVKAPAIKAHGTTSAGQIATSILMAEQFLINNLVDNISQNIEQSLVANEEE